jgi:AbrB family looped-hinge helix DNA binding protein
MRTTIDAAGRMVVPKPLRDELGFTAGAELDARVVDGRLEVILPSRVRVEEGPHGVRFTADTDTGLSAEDVRDVLERSRR